MKITRINPSPIFDLLVKICHPAGPTPCQQIQQNPPVEFKGWQKRVSLSDLTPEAEDDGGKWINKLFSKERSYEDMIKFVENLGYTTDTAQEILKRGVEIAERSADWANDVCESCGSAAISIITSLPFAVGKAALNNFFSSSNIHPILQKLPSVLDGLYTGIRNFLQNKIYGGRPDDDRAQNIYERGEYGNNVSAFWGTLAYHTETKVNLWALPLLGLSSNKTQETLKPFLLSINPMWFRVRMGSDIDHKFTTNLFNYLIHKPLSILGFKRSKETVEQIQNDENGNLKPEYIKTRTIENIGLDPSKQSSIKDIISELFKLTHNLFKKDTDNKTKKRSCDKVAKCLSPYLGLYGFLALLASTPVKSILKHFLDKDNKYLNSFFQSGFASQHLEYIFKFVLPEQYENNLQEFSKINPELNKLKSDRNKLFTIGLSTFLINIFSVGFKLINIENKYLRFLRDIYNELADKGVAYYFSRRRELLGRKHKLDNPELYDNGTVKLISDKIDETKEDKQPRDPDEKVPVVIKHLSPMKLSQAK